MPMEEMGEWIDIINDELDCFQYLLTTKPRSLASNMPKDNLDHLLSEKKTKLTKNKPKPPRINYEFKASKYDNSFMDLSDILINLKKPHICNMTLDELLDKISFQGIESLTEIEKQKLVEYSNLI
jgi:hypothetical protein